MPSFEINNQFGYVDPKYCDYNSTTPLPRVLLDSIRSNMEIHWANPSSLHSTGQIEKEHLDKNRKTILQALGCPSARLTVCGGATEAANIAFHSLAAPLTSDDVILVSKVEHSCLLADKRRSAGYDCRLIEIPLDQYGIIQLDTVASLVKTHAGRVKGIVCQAANNETGVVQPIGALREILGDNLPLLVDYSQAVGKLQGWRELINLSTYAVVSPHKFYGPKGSGLLISRCEANLIPFYFGGGQEKNIRPGTENVGIIATLAVWAGLIVQFEESTKSIIQFRDNFESALKSNCPSFDVLGRQAPRISNTSAIYIPGLDANAFVFALDSLGYAIATGSACHSGAEEPSHVFLEYGLTWEQARQVIRLSFGLGNLSLNPADLALDMKVASDRLYRLSNSL